MAMTNQERQANHRARRKAGGLKIVNQLEELKHGVTWSFVRDGDGRATGGKVAIWFSQEDRALIGDVAGQTKKTEAQVVDVIVELARVAFMREVVGGDK